MTTQEIAAALRRVTSVLHRRPEAGIHVDAPASARWAGGLKVVASDANGYTLGTDMPAELGGGGREVTPGWLLRAALASCATTRIAMAAAAEGIELSRLELTASSRSDVRGLLGMKDNAGATIPAGPHEVHLRVRIGAPGIPAERLRLLVQSSHDTSPVSCAMQEPIAVALQIDVEDR